MKRWGLVAAGSAGGSFLSHYPLLKKRLGPVGSTSYRLAVRISNALRAGTAVRDLAAFADADVVAICVPGGGARRMAHMLGEAGLEWRGRILLLCQCGVYSGELPEFRQWGAAVASINPLDTVAGRYILEGDAVALAEARSVVRAMKGKAIEVEPARVELLEAAVTLSGSLFTPLIETMAESFRQAGLAGPAAVELAHALLTESLRTFMRAGRKSWSGPVPRADRTRVTRQYEALVRAKPLMGEYFRNAADFAFALYRTYPELTRYNKSRWGLE